MSFGAFAYSTLPPEGSINMEAYPGGINSVNVVGDYSVNRDADAFVSLYRGNDLLVRIPASSVNDIKCVSGYDVVDHGQLEVYFFGMTGPGANGGDYTVKFDAGLFNDYATGVPNEEVSFSYSVPYKTQEFIQSISPAIGVAEELSEFTITLVEGATATGASFSLIKTGSTEVEYPVTASVNGNVITLKTAAPITEKGTYSLALEGLTVNYNGLSVAYNGVTMGGINWSYTIMDKTGVPAVTPVPGTYMGFEAFTADCFVGGQTLQKNVFFTLNFEEDLMYVLMGRPYWVRLNDDGTEDSSTKILLAILQGQVNDEATGTASVAKRFAYVGPSTNDVTQLISSPGKYRLVIPSGCYSLQGVGLNPVNTFDYEIIANDNFKYVLAPVDGSKLKQLEYVTVTFDEGMIIDMTPTSYATITDGITRYTLNGKLTDGLTNEVTFYLSHPITESGTWQFISPSSGFNVNGVSPVVTATYIVDADMVVEEHTYTLTPAPGSELNELSSFVLEYEGFNFFGLTGQGAPVLTNGTESYSLECYSQYPDGTGYVMTLTEPITTPGQYFLSIPANYLEVMCFDENWERVPGTDLFRNGTIYEAYNVVPETVEVSYVLTPATGASFDDDNVLTAITLEFPDAESIQAMMINPVISNGTDSQTLTYNVVDNKAIFDISEALTTGEWTFNLNANAFYVTYADGKSGSSPAIEATYSVVYTPAESGVAGVEAAEGNVTVYNAAGVCLLNNAPAEALSTLEPGFYIVNGKKVVLTK